MAMTGLRLNVQPVCRVDKLKGVVHRQEQDLGLRVCRSYGHAMCVCMWGPRPGLPYDIEISFRVTSKLTVTGRSLLTRTLKLRSTRLSWTHGHLDSERDLLPEIGLRSDSLGSRSLSLPLTRFQHSVLIN